MGVNHIQAEMKPRSGKIKDQQEALYNERRSESEKFKKAAEKEKGDLATALYTLAQACSEEAGIHKKLASTTDMMNQSNTWELYEKNLERAEERVKELKRKVLSLGYTDPDLKNQLAPPPSRRDFEGRKGMVGNSPDEKDGRKGMGMGFNKEQFISGISQKLQSLTKDYEWHSKVQHDAPETAKIRQELIHNTKEYINTLQKALDEVKTTQRLETPIKTKAQVAEYEKNNQQLEQCTCSWDSAL